ncbi:MAG: hypothetical protein H6828_01410 [Planctomycetes bacterium]|nr:hypothetical protein [Planctomycetota bacterium]
MAEDVWAPTPADLDQAAVAAMFAPQRAGGALDGAEFVATPDARLEAGTTLRFGPGVHVLDERRLRGEDGRTLPSDVTIVGAGKDATLLRLGDLGAQGSLARLAFRDLTLDCDDDGLFDHRSDVSSVRMERVRVVRFDAGHGGCTVFSFNGGAVVHATDCEFLGGYGRAPGRGSLLRPGPPFLMRFERCRFRLIELRFLSSLDADSAAVLVGCQFELLGSDPLGWSNEHVRLEGCSSTPIPADTPPAELQLQLTDLFPGA